MAGQESIGIQEQNWSDFFLFHHAEPFFLCSLFFFVREDLSEFLGVLCRPCNESFEDVEVWGPMLGALKFT